MQQQRWRTCAMIGNLDRDVLDYQRCACLRGHGCGACVRYDHRLHQLSSCFYSLHKPRAYAVSVFAFGSPSSGGSRARRGAGTAVLIFSAFLVFALAERKNEKRYDHESTVLPSILSLPVLSLPVLSAVEGSKGRRAGYQGILFATA